MAPRSSSTAATAATPNGGRSTASVRCAPWAGAWTCPAARTANGAQLQLWDCNGTGAQVWQARGDGTLLNPNSNKCLDATGFGTDDGTRLQIWSCHGGSNQVWRLP